MVDLKPGGASSWYFYLKLAALLATGNLLAWLIPSGAGFLEAFANSKEAASWAGVLVTGAALLLSWVLWWNQTKRTEKMQQQALMPHLTFVIHVFRDRTPHLRIELLNNGLGPAIIGSFRCSFDNISIEGGAAEFAHFLTARFEELLPGTDWDSRFANIDRGDWISKDGSVELIAAETEQPETLQSLFKRPEPQINIEINRFRIDVSYESVFKEKVFDTAPWKLDFKDPENQG